MIIENEGRDERDENAVEVDPRAWGFKPAPWGELEPWGEDVANDTPDEAA